MSSCASPLLALGDSDGAHTLVLYTLISSVCYGKELFQAERITPLLP